jgi:hypothetical protein
MAEAATAPADIRKAQEVALLAWGVQVDGQAVAWRDMLAAARQEDAGLAAAYRDLLRRAFAAAPGRAGLRVQWQHDGAGPRVIWCDAILTVDGKTAATVARSRTVRVDAGLWKSLSPEDAARRKRQMESGVRSEAAALGLPSQ